MFKKARTARRIPQLAEDSARRVTIYIRRSADEDHQPFSLEAQETKLRAFVASQPGDWQIVAVYPDDASGATTDRPGLQKALRAARAGLFDTLLVYRVDRFSRSLRDLTTLLDDLADADIVFRSATEPFDTSTPVGRMLVQMLGVFAEFERETIIDRVINGMERKAAKGLWTGSARPLGYHVDRASDNLVPDPAEAATVRTIFDLYTHDRLGTQAIATHLNNQGLRTRMGKPWSQHTIELILTNRTYLGEKRFRDITVPHAHPALISATQPTPPTTSSPAKSAAHSAGATTSAPPPADAPRPTATTPAGAAPATAPAPAATSTASTPTISKRPSAPPCWTSTPPAATSSTRQSASSTASTSPPAVDNFKLSSRS
jgi:site-specific DNA recombinase